MEITKPTKYLADWFSRYTKNRDLLFRKIAELKEEDNKIIILGKDGITTYYYAEPFIEDFESIARGISEQYKGIVVYNTFDNFNKLLKSWTKLSEIKNLTIYFVNPFSKQDKRWIINPYVHNKISDKESFELGIRAMSELVDITTRQEIEQLTK